MDDDGLIARMIVGDGTALREPLFRHAPWLAPRLRAALPHERGVGRWGSGRPERSGAARRASVVVAGLVAAALVTADCSGGSNGPGIASTGNTKTPTALSTANNCAGNCRLAHMIDYASCMRSHGVPRGEAVPERRRRRPRTNRAMSRPWCAARWTSPARPVEKSSWPS